MKPSSPKQFYRWHNQETEKGYKSVIIAGIFFTLLAHLLVLILFKNTNLIQSVFSEEELVTEQLSLERVVIEQDEIKPETLPEIQPESIAEHIEELEDLLPELVDQDIDLSTEIEEPEVALTVTVPTKLGSEDGIFEDLLPTEAVMTSLEELGNGANLLNEAADGQVIIDEGSVSGEWLDSELEIDNSFLKGAEGEIVEGALSDYRSLDELLQMSSVSIQGAKAALPSDLMFEYNSAELKESARFGLMKLAMLIDQNEQMYCILEGHTDLSGSDTYNQTLSIARAQSVRNWLVNSMRLSDEKLIVRGYGKQFPIVEGGSIEQQSVNRRVDILLRKELPALRTAKSLIKQPALTPEEENTSPPKAEVVEEKQSPVRAIPVRPIDDAVIMKAIPVQE